MGDGSCDPKAHFRTAHILTSRWPKPRGRNHAAETQTKGREVRAARGEGGKDDTYFLARHSHPGYRAERTDDREARSGGMRVT